MPAVSKRRQHINEASMSTSSQLMAGKRGLVMGVANDRSIAWGIASTLAAHGAELAFTYQGDALAKRVKPLAESVKAPIVVPCDVTDEASLDATFKVIEDQWGKLDFLVHAIAFSDKNELDGMYLNTSRANFARTMDISCYSFTACCQRAVPLMKDGGSMITLSYYGAERVMPHYNVMGVAKSGAGGKRTLPRDRPRSPEYPRQRHFGWPHQDTGGERHRRLPLYPQVE
jgi:enoyl-[acyl-carrier protein] reductase I